MSIFLALLGAAAWRIRSVLVEKADRLAVDGVDAQLARELGEDPELQKKFGRFRRLDGEGFDRRESAFMTWPRIEWQRQVVFENGSVPVNITLFADKSASLSQRQWRLADWYYDESPGHPPSRLKVEAYPSGPFDQAMATEATAVAFSDDGTLLLIAKRGRFDVWNIQSRALVRSHKGKFGLIECLETAGEAGLVAIASTESNRILEVETGNITVNWTRQIPSHKAGPIDISQDGKTVIGNIRDPSQERSDVGSFTDQSVPAPHVIANIHRGGEMKPIIATTQAGEFAGHVFLSPDGNFAMLGLVRSFGEIWWDVRNERAMAENLIGDPKIAKQVPWKGFVAFGPRSGNAFVWRHTWDKPGPPVELALPAVAEIRSFETPKNLIGGLYALAMDISHDERWLALLTEDAVHVWKVATGKLSRTTEATGFDCWMTVPGDSGTQTTASPIAHRPNYDDGTALMIDLNGRVMLATREYLKIRVWVERDN